MTSIDTTTTTTPDECVWLDLYWYPFPCDAVVIDPCTVYDSTLYGGFLCEGDQMPEFCTSWPDHPACSYMLAPTTTSTTTVEVGVPSAAPTLPATGNEPAPLIGGVLVVLGALMWASGQRRRGTRWTR